MGRSLGLSDLSSWLDWGYVVLAWMALKSCCALPRASGGTSCPCVLLPLTLFLITGFRWYMISFFSVRLVFFSLWNWQISLEYFETVLICFSSNLHLLIFYLSMGLTINNYHCSICLVMILYFAQLLLYLLTGILLWGSAAHSLLSWTEYLCLSKIHMLKSSLPMW